MVRLADLHQAGQESARALDCPRFEDKPFVPPKPRAQRRVVLISSAGLSERGAAPFRGGDAGYRCIGAGVADKDIMVSHISVNFDRTAAIRNIETLLPRTTLSQMAASGEIAAAHPDHYSFMGATDPLKMEADAMQLATSLRKEQVDTAVFLPV